MKARHVIAVLAVASSAAAAGARQGLVVYSIAFGSPVGPNTIALTPGQTTPVFVSVAVSWGPPLPILGFADGAFSITGAGTGTGAWGVDSNTASPTYSLPNPWGAQAIGGAGVNPGNGGASGVSGVVWGYGLLLTTLHPFPQNPATVWRGTFTAMAPGSVDASFTGLKMTHVFAYTAPTPTAIAILTLPGVGGSITIIPAPAGLALVGLGGLAALRRQRT